MGTHLLASAAARRWITSQFTGRFIFFPEVVRNVAFTVLALVMAASDGSLTFALVPLVVLEGAPCCVAARRAAMKLS